MRAARIGFVISATGAAVAAVAVAACVGDDPPATPGTADSGTPASDAASDGSAATDSGGDAAIDGGVDAARCNSNAAFGSPVQVVDLSSANNKDETSPALSEDEQRIFFVSNRDGADRIFYAERTSSGKFGPAARLDALIGNVANANAYIERVTITEDEKTLYFGWSPDGLQEFKIWVAQRTTTTAPPVFSTPELVNGITEPQAYGAPFVNAVGTRLYYSAETAAGSNLFTLQSVDCTAPAQCGTRRSFPALGTNEPFGEGTPVLTRDEKTMFFASARDGGSAGKTAIYVTTRPDVNGAFLPPELVVSIRPSIISPGWLSRDGCRLYVASNQNGNSDIFVMTRP